MNIRDNVGPVLTRRGFGATLVAGVVGAAALPRVAGAAAAELAAGRGMGQVVGFHADAPWLDGSGRDRPYRPPHATGQFAADSESLMRLGHFL